MRSGEYVLSTGRAATVAAALTAVSATAAWSLITVLRDALGIIRSPGRSSLDEVVIAASAAAALALLVWFALGLLASVAATMPGRGGATGRAIRDRVAPVTVRRCAAVLLGVTLMSSCGPEGAVASPGPAHPSLTTLTAEAPAPAWAAPSAAARETASAPQTAAAPGTASAPAPEWVPGSIRALPSVTLTTPRPELSETREVTVRAGDTLWDLAAAQLSSEATDAEIASQWQRWYATNREVIGVDPDLILPGQLLRVPASADATPAGGHR